MLTWGKVSEDFEFMYTSAFKITFCGLFRIQLLDMVNLTFRIVAYSAADESG